MAPGRPRARRAPCRLCRGEPGCPGLAALMCCTVSAINGRLTGARGGGVRTVCRSREDPACQGFPLAAAGLPPGPGEGVITEPSAQGVRALMTFPDNSRDQATAGGEAD